MDFFTIQRKQPFKQCKTILQLCGPGVAWAERPSGIIDEYQHVMTFSFVGLHIALKTIQISNR